MRRVLVVGGGVAVVALACWLVWWWERPPQPAPATQPVAVHYSDLSPSVYQKGTYRGQVVRVAYPLPLQPTADPLVWEFRPGSSTLPPTHRVHFAGTPAFPDRLPVVVVGTVDGIHADGLIRLNNVPGVVVIRSASVVPASSP